MFEGVSFFGRSEVEVIGSRDNLNKDLKCLEPLSLLGNVVKQCMLDLQVVFFFMNYLEFSLLRLVKESFLESRDPPLLVEGVQIKLSYAGQRFVHVNVLARVDKLSNHKFEHSAEFVDGGAVDVQLLNQVADHLVAERQGAPLRLQHYVDRVKDDVFH